MKFYKSGKFWKRLVLFGLGIPVLLFGILVAVLYWKQDAIVQYMIGQANKDFKGRVELKDSHISLFANFPYISIDLEEVRIFEDKDEHDHPIVEVHDLYLGFDIWTIISGNMEVKLIKMKDGVLNLVQHADGSFNVSRALETNEKEVEDPNAEFHLDLKEMIFENIDVTKYNESSGLLVDCFITYADSRFRTNPEHVFASLESKFELSIIQNGDTSFIKHKHFEVETEFDFIKSSQIMTIAPTEVLLEGADFDMEGSIDLFHDANLDLHFSGSKPNFDLFIAMAPEELIPVLKKYENQGRIFFDATVKGKSANGNRPSIDAKFGCEHAYFNNFSVNKKLDDLNFAGYFTNGANRDISTMEFGLTDFSAKPEAGIFSGNLIVKNFESPDITLQLKSDFELEFLAKFFEVTTLKDLGGRIALTMNFHDIIDLTAPERAIERLNESYFTQLKVENLHFRSDNYKLPIKDIDLYIEMNGHEADIQYCNAKVGKSDVQLKGSISDLPAIIHHTDIPVKTTLAITGKRIDLFELTGSDSLTSFNEMISNLSMQFTFKSSARAFTESKFLPLGEFFVDNLYAKLSHYPHTLHDFHADVFIDENDFRVVDFKGMIDKSDFIFSGKLNRYDLWFSEHPAGDTRIEFDLVSHLLKLEDVFSYKGENYVPEDYRHEELRELKVHGLTDLHFKEGLQSMDIRLDRLDARMKVHPMKAENFKGRIHYEKEHLVVEDFSGKLGKSIFRTTMHYYMGKDEAVKKRDNRFELNSPHLDFDELFSYNAIPSSKTSEPVDHDAGFNIYDLPFSDMSIQVNIGHLNYHKYLLHNLKGKLRMTKNHYLHIDELHLEAAGGAFDMTGYFNGSNPKLIYFSPKMNVRNVDLDKLLFKFDNFGQDHLVSENLHGKLSGTITGKIHMHNDLVPKIDDSEIHLDVTVLNGRLENYALFDYMAEYFADKNMKKVMFDTLTNKIDIVNGTMNIPKMSINSSIGFMEISGKQEMGGQMNMEYYIRVPWKMVTQAASSKLFGKKTEEVDPEQIDAIQYADPEKKIRYVNVKVTGNALEYKISLGKEKKK